MFKATPWLTFCLFLLLLPACSTQSLVSPRLSDWSLNQHTNLLYIPAEFRILEVPLGGKEERVVEWEKNASKFYSQAMEQTHFPNWTLQNNSALTSLQNQVVDQHYSLFLTMLPQIMMIKGDAIEVMKNKRQAFNYTVGSGMKELAQTTQIQYVVFAAGQDKIRSNSKRIVDSLLNLNPLTIGRVAPYGTLAMAVIELTTGDIIWFDTAQSQRFSFNDESDMKKKIQELMGAFLNEVGRIKKGA